MRHIDGVPELNLRLSPIPLYYHKNCFVKEWTADADGEFQSKMRPE
jgi:hypothetical protein